MEVPVNLPGRGQQAFYTVDQFAEIFGMRPNQVRKRIRQGKIAAINIGSPNRHEYRISAAAMKAFIAAAEVRVR